MSAIRYLALVLICFMLLGACAPAVQEEPEPERISGAIRLVDPESSAPEELPFAPESPAAANPSAINGEPEPSREQEPQPQSAPSQPESPALSASSSTAPQPEASAPPVQESASQGDTSQGSASQADTLPMVSAPSIRKTAISGEVRSIWISYLEMDSLLKGKTQAQFTANIVKVFDNCAAYGLNTVIVHVRPFADALYESQYYPWSYLCTGTEGAHPGFDPLAIMVEEAHARNLRLEAWVNPYRIRAADSKYAISEGNQAKKWLDAGDDAVIVYNGVTSYNPASKKAQELIVNGVREIVKNYNVDGIHIDDYFYPATSSGAVDMGFDAASYKAYQNGGGTLSQANWRRQNVETLLKAMYAGIKAEDPNVLFGISPQSSVYNNYHAMFLDVAKVAANPGYCDYICPQIYFGYQNGTQPYAQTVEAWEKLVDGSVVDLYVGLAVYKVGAVDSWAGNGKQEWTQNTDLLRRMVETARGQSTYKGFVLYRYDSIFSPVAAVADHVDKEAANLKGILK